MRRRIEETRARLKAKAFDAMMSGEAALLSRDSGEKPVPSADDVADRRRDRLRHRRVALAGRLLIDA